MSIAKIAPLTLDTLSGVVVSPLPVITGLVVITGGVLLGLGLLRRGDPATAFAAGMGAYVLLLTALGVAGISLRIGIAAATILAAGAAWVRRGELAHWARPAGIGLALLLPLLLLLSDRHGSEWDEFSHWLHAFRYLASYHQLPGGPDAPTIASCCAAYPYAWPMVGEAAMALIGFSEAIPALLNTMVLGLFAILLGKLAAEAAGINRPGPGLWATALLFATLLSPSFVPKLAFSAYADVITAFLVATLVVAAERLSTKEDGESNWRWGLAFGLIGGALLAVKPGNAALFGCAFGAAVLMTVRNRGPRALLGREWLPALILPLLCAGLWRWHVSQYLSGQEMGVRPFADWNIHLIPAIIQAMGSVASQKGGHFGLGLAVSAFGLMGLIRCRDRLDRLSAVVGMLFVGYNLFLLTTYVAVFGAQDGLNVMSFWRYNTHVGLAVTLPAAMLAGRYLGRFAGRTWMRGLGIAAVFLTLAGPLATAWYIRFDLDPMKIHYRQTLRQLPAMVPPTATIEVMDPHGSGLSQVMAIYEWNDRKRFSRGFSAFSVADPLVWLNGAPTDWAIVLSGQERLNLPATEGALLVHREGNSWHVAEAFPYPGRVIPKQWP
ncbi:hypothetical protein CCC_00733 [Paramagnetospirillum magnetotacticum MS-1]|uniref:Glycosyltransferase RgtA/B/C/D-like domain-containing protein n=1 Tax=Paramagnetospirillum magnetotacticum MS-1 TaxID=272627 RepID=A0A0C2U864_PARME|nr:hypothetical protein [Paramagnetospirillum magnetotacticum]KIL97672.1 hypothetical protein CCC_00733 [Paramagnetospirillum magnetotacticum MS-1]